MARRIHRLVLASMPLGAFALYWLSSFVLVARNGTLHFHADTWLYAELAEENLFDRIVPDSQLARIFRFHPLTVVMAAAWMKLFSPLTAWVAPQFVLKAMFAAVGAVGVWAAVSAFAAVVPRRQVTAWGAIYASSLGVWYFSSIEESKIVTATLSALYIATYLHLRTRWTTRAAALLTTILLLACLNEIAASFLIIIPVVDTLMQRGWDLRHTWWIVVHGLASPLALAILEGVMRGLTTAAGSHPEGANHFSMFIWYASQNEISAKSLYKFAIQWLFFNVAAPERHADHWANFSINFGGNFEPVLANYFLSPISIGLVTLFGVMLCAAVLPQHRGASANNCAGLLLALLAYALLRSTFFFFFNSKECFLFSSSATLAHMLLLAIPFSASRFPAKGSLLLVFAILLFINNGAFIIG
jgi:hypothetical protein